MKYTKKLISLFLLAAMMLSMCVPAMAEEPEMSQAAENDRLLLSGEPTNGEPEEIEEPDPEGMTAYIGTKGYADLAAAFASAKSGDTIVLKADQTLSTRLTASISGNKNNITVTDDGKTRTVYCCNTGTKSADGYGRAFQINGGATLTLQGTGEGKLILCGRSSDIDDSGEYAANYGSLVYAYNGTAVLRNLTVRESGASAVYAYSGENAVGCISVESCVFTENTAETGADIYIAADGELTFVGQSSAYSVYSETAPVKLAGSFSEKRIKLFFADTVSLAQGEQLFTGSTETAAYGIVVNGLDAGLKIGTDGSITARRECRIGTTEYDTLAAAVAEASAKDTITLIDDVCISSRLSVTKNLTVIDDGHPHTVYVYNTDSGESQYGRGIQVGSNKTLNITATQKGNITIVGHDPAGEIYNLAAVLYVYRGILVLNRVTVTECKCTNYGPITTYNDYYSNDGTDNLYVGTAELNDCTVTGNTTSYKNGGAAVYNMGNLKLNAGTAVCDNYATSTVSGGIYNGDSDISGKYGAASHATGVTTVNGSVTVSGNKKNCSQQEGSGISGDGDDSDIYVSAAASLNFLSLTGKVGVDCAQTMGEEFAVCASAFAGNAGVVKNRDITKVATKKSATALAWDAFCTITLGSASDDGMLNYYFGSASVTMPGGSGNALTVAVDSGYFTADLSEFSNVTGVSYVDMSGYHTGSDELSSATKLRGISLVGTWTAQAAQSFLRSVCFTVKKDGMTQTVTAGILPQAPQGGVFMGAYSYYYINTPCTAAYARMSAENVGGRLVCIKNDTENELISGIGGQGWIGGRLLSDNWYWQDGSRMSANAASSQGYEGAYIAWGDAQPGTGTEMIASGGKWYSREACEEYGYFYQVYDSNSVSVSTTLKESKTKLSLTAISLKIQDGVSVNYFLTVPQKLIDSELSKVVITVGENSTEHYFAQLCTEENRSETDSSYKITVPMRPKDFDAAVKLEFYGVTGKPLGTVGGEGKTNYNVAWYVNNIIEKKGQQGGNVYSGELVELGRALLDYGECAKAQFVSGYEYTGDSEAMTDTASITGAVFEKTANAEARYTVSLVSDSDTLMCIAPDTDKAFAVCVDGVSAAAENGVVYIPVSAEKLGRCYTVSFTGEFTGEIKLNAIAVIKAIIDSPDCEKTAKLTADRLYKLSLRANSYFGVYVPATGIVETVINTAYAYLENTKYIQYDQHAMVNSYYSGYYNARRQMNIYPEDANEQNTVYMDCSSFVYNVYARVFGSEAVCDAVNIEQTSFTTKNLINCSTEAMEAVFRPKTENIYSQLISTLQPGDLLVKYRYGTTAESAHGHVVLWTGNGYIHCTGASYDYTAGVDKVEENGAIFFVPASNFNAGWYSGFDTVAVIRPLNVLGQSAQADVARGQLGGMSVTKTAFAGEKALFNGRSVTTGDTVKYVITLNNKVMNGTVTMDRTVHITDALPTGMTGSEALDWTVTVKAGECIKLEYFATVTADSGTVIAPTSGSCTVAEAGENGRAVSFKNNEISVGKACSQQVNGIISAARSYSGTPEDALSALNAILSDNIGSTLCASDASWVSGLFYKNGSSYFVYYGDNTLKKYLVANFASGRKVLNYKYGDGNYTTGKRVRNITADNLEAGDVTAVYLSGSDTYRYYIYLGGNDMLYLESGKESAIVSASATLSNLYNKSVFAVLRPAGRA